jgi:hypothetical protein
MCMYTVYLVYYIISLHLAAYFMLELPSKSIILNQLDVKNFLRVIASYTVQLPSHKS